MNPITFILLGLATWRLSVLVVREDGPFRVFRKIRELVGITHDEFGKVLQVPDTFWASLLSCVWCTSVWVAVGWMVARYFLPAVAVPLAALFALSAFAIGFDRLFDSQTPR